MTRFGEAPQIVFITAGGPGISQGNALRVRAPTQMVRAFAEHWLMFFYKASWRKGMHATLIPDEAGRRFSMHRLSRSGSPEESLFFETTHSWERECEDFREFLHEYEAAITVASG